MTLTDEELAQLPLFLLTPYPREDYDAMDLRALPWLTAGYRRGWWESLPLRRDARVAQVKKEAA